MGKLQKEEQSATSGTSQLSCRHCKSLIVLYDITFHCFRAIKFSYVVPSKKSLCSEVFFCLMPAWNAYNFQLRKRASCRLKQLNPLLIKSLRIFHGGDLYPCLYGELNREPYQFYSVNHE